MIPLLKRTPIYILEVLTHHKYLSTEPNMSQSHRRTIKKLRRFRVIIILNWNIKKTFTLPIYIDMNNIFRFCQIILKRVLMTLNNNIPRVCSGFFAFFGQEEWNQSSEQTNLFSIEDFFRMLFSLHIFLFFEFKLQHFNLNWLNKFEPE